MSQFDQAMANMETCLNVAVALMCFFLALVGIFAFLWSLDHKRVLRLAQAHAKASVKIEDAHQLLDAIYLLITTLGKCPMCGVTQGPHSLQCPIEAVQKWLWEVEKKEGTFPPRTKQGTDYD